MNMRLMADYLLNKMLGENRFKKVYCKDCETVGAGKRELSILILIFYIVITIVSFIIFRKAYISLLLLAVLTFINMKLTKPKCPNCRSSNVRFATDSEIAEAEKNIPAEEIVDINEEMSGDAENTGNEKEESSNN